MPPCYFLTKWSYSWNPSRLCRVEVKPFSQRSCWHPLFSFGEPDKHVGCCLACIDIWMLRKWGRFECKQRGLAELHICQRNVGKDLMKPLLCRNHGNKSAPHWTLNGKTSWIWAQRRLEMQLPGCCEVTRVQRRLHLNPERQNQNQAKQAPSK